MFSNHPETISHPPVEKLSSMKLVPCAKKVETTVYLILYSVFRFLQGKLFLSGNLPLVKPKTAI